MEKEKISVIIPTYNRESLIIRSIKSVLNQTYENIEVIVVDDGSTDNTKAKVSSIKDKRVKYVTYAKNKGACYARNLGIKKATGDYIAFQDSDDVFEKDKLKKQLENLKRNNSDLDFCKFEVINQDKKYCVPSEELEDKLKNKKYLDLLVEGNFVSTQTILGKRNVFDNILFDEKLPRLQDYDLILRIASDYKISYTNNILVHVYIQKDSVSTSDEKLKKACYIMMHKNYGHTEKQKYSLYESLLNCLFHKFRVENILLNDNYSNLSNEYKNLQNQFNTIVNSKGWKMLEKLRKVKSGK